MCEQRPKAVTSTRFVTGRHPVVRRPQLGEEFLYGVSSIPNDLLYPRFALKVLDHGYRNFSLSTSVPACPILFISASCALDVV